MRLKIPIILALIKIGHAFESCSREGLCLGHLIEVQENVFSMQDCTERCRIKIGCNFASFHSNAKTCTMSRSCSKVVLRDQPYRHQSPIQAENCIRKRFTKDPYIFKHYFVSFSCD